jgi:multiple sugar transport system permease protein
LGWLVIAGGAGLLIWWLVTEVRGGVSVIGFILRLLVAVIAEGLLLLVVLAFAPEARPGTLMVTLVYVFFGITFQFLLGLGLAYLCTQRLVGRRFFRIIFLLPMMITPVGVAYMFEMLTDTQKGPFHPVFTFLGDSRFTWVNNPWGARTAVMISDIWQWTPFMFIVLLAAIEAQDVETQEAALVDGANRWQIFRNITWPGIIPVSTTLILIRMIEGFKIIDLPNILTNGGPGTATESLTLEAYIDWRTFDLGRSAAIAYLLLILVTVAATTYVNLIRRRAVGN